METDLGTRYEGQGFIFPLNLFQSMCSAYFGGNRDTVADPLLTGYVACPEALAGQLLACFFGEGKTHSEQFGTPPEDEQGGGDQTSPTERVMQYRMEMLRKMKAQGAAAKREQTNGNGHDGTDEESEGSRSDPQASHGS